MKNINRKIQPDFQELKPLSFIKAEKSLLENKIPIYTINAGEQEIVKIDIIFEAGDWYQPAPLVANSTLNLLQEGSVKYTADEIAEKLDFIGSYVYYSTNKHSSTITICSLNKYFEETIKIIEDVIKNPLFIDEKVETYKSKKFQLYTIESEKVEVIAQKKFSHAIFGEQHPYGITPEPEQLKKINIEELKTFHNEYFSPLKCKIIIAGKTSQFHKDILQQYFGENNWNSCGILSKLPEYEINPAKNKLQYFEKEGAVQSAIRVGKMLVNKHNPDFQALQVVNTILGGYFGSRLMTNIREDKGYTYGISSGIVSHRNSGYFVIVSQVGKDVNRKALDEVYYELKRLRTEIVPEEELKIVKNYMLSTLARNFDGPFESSDSFKSILEHDLGYEYYERFWNVVTNITAKEIKNLANTYLNEDSMYEIIAG